MVGEGKGEIKECRIKGDARGVAAPGPIVFGANNLREMAKNGMHCLQP